VGDRIKALSAALEAVNSRPETGAPLRDCLNDLRRFAATHFAAEEKLMEDVFYPERADHVRRHRDFLAWLDRLEAASRDEPRRVRAAGPTVVLAGWWEAHALGQDRALSEFLCRGGL